VESHIDLLEEILWEAIQILQSQGGVAVAVAAVAEEGLGGFDAHLHQRRNSNCKQERGRKCVIISGTTNGKINRTTLRSEAH